MRTFQDAFETRKWFIIYQCFFTLHNCCIFKHIPNLVQHCHIRNSMHIENAAKDFAKIVNGLNFFAKTFCLRYLIGLWTRLCINKLYTAQKMKFSIKDFSSKYDQMRSFLRTWSHLLEKYLMENFIFCAVQFVQWL